MKMKIVLGVVTLAIITAGVTQLEKSEPIYEEVDQEKVDDMLSSLCFSKLEEMHSAGEKVLAFGSSVLEFTKGTHIKNIHYPQGDVFYRGAQYFFHRHRNKEHGHFHLFLREEAFPENVTPTREKDFSHLVAIEVDKEGQPRALFTTNRWVTGEGERSPEEIEEMLDRFEIKGDSPSRELNQWISAMACLFRPQIVQLIRESETKGEVKASLPISVEKQMASIRRHYRH